MGFKTPMGVEIPRLKIYDTNADSNVGGIEFYKKVGEVDSLDNS